MNEKDKALENYTKCISLAKQIGDRQMESKVLLNVGRIYFDRKNIEKAEECYSNGLKIAEEIGVKGAIAQGYELLSTIRKAQKRMPEALGYLNKALLICRETGDSKLESQVLLSVAEIDYENHRDAEAYENTMTSLAIAKKIGNVLTISEASSLLANISARKGDFSEAYKYLKAHYQMRDSVNNISNRKAAIRSQFQSEYNSKVLADSVKNIEINKVKDAQLMVQQSKLKQERITRIALFGGLALVLIFAGFMYNRFKITNSQKKIIENQKVLVEEKQKEVMDSITYAKRLQLAILPPVKLINEELGDNFVFYKPKAIVAGDFYWLHKSEGNELLIAAADCTGHGVPGALVSVVCSNALNQSVNEFKLKEPGQILDKTRQLVLDTFSKSEGEVKDGMDISICSISRNKDSVCELKWAGANNSLFLMLSNENAKNDLLKLKDSADRSFYEIKGDKQPVGQYYDPKPFRTHSLQLQKGDTIYLLTDGFADQFGGADGKKFKYKQLQEVIFANSALTMKEQGESLDKVFENWKGSLEQVDDVCVIGIRI
jgi:hypothetical protein